MYFRYMTTGRPTNWGIEYLWATGEGPEIQGDMILPEIINPDGRPGPSECRVYTAQGGLLRTNYPCPGPV